MPRVIEKKGNASVSISRQTLKLISQEIRKPQVLTLGINSKAAFVEHAVAQYLMRVRSYELSFFETRFETRSFYENRVVIRDYYEVLDFEVVIQEAPSTKEAMLYCEIERSHSCVHVGFAFSIPEVLEACQKKGLKVRKHLEE